MAYLSLNLSNNASKFVDGLQAKQFKQVMSKILDLTKNPTPNDYSKLKGYDDIYRVDVGEYRITYKFTKESVDILVVGPRNDDEVYKQLKRK